MAVKADILLSVYGKAPYLEEFLQSLQNQTCKDFRLLYRFDGDVFAENINLLANTAFAEEVTDRNHCGVNASYEKLLAVSDAEYCLLADQDDIWHADKLAKTLNILVDTQARCGSGCPVLVHSDLRVVDAGSRVIADSMSRYQALAPEKYTLKDLIVQNNVTGCTIGCNRALAELAHFPSEAICHDWYMALIASAFGKIVFCRESLIDYRQHGNNVFGAAPRRRLLRKIFHRSELHKKIVKTQLQAAAFRRQFAARLLPEQNDMLAAWSSNLDEKSYLRRLNVMIRNGFCKNDFLRTLGMWFAA